VPVNDPDEINEIFDDISYNKGGSLIRMMAHFLGIEVFNRGIELYLKRHNYGNAKQVIFFLWLSFLK
jgi:aminopeptidase N